VRAWAARFFTSIHHLSPEQAALLLVVGLVLGVFPIVGCPTLLCLLAALTLRLNLPALQLLNNVTSPLQLGLLLPLERAGAWLCGGTHAAAGNIGLAALHAVVGWAAVCLPAGALGFVILVQAMRKRRPAWCNSMESPA